MVLLAIQACRDILMSKSADGGCTQSHSVLPNLLLARLHCALAELVRSQSILSLAMSTVDYELKAAGGDYATRYAGLDDNGWVMVPINAKFLSAVSQAQYQTGEETEDHIAVQLWALVTLVDGAYEPSELGLFASDSMVLANVVGIASGHIASGHIACGHTAFEQTVLSPFCAPCYPSGLLLPFFIVSQNLDDAHLLLVSRQ